MQKITNAELGRPTSDEFAMMEKIPVVVVLDNLRSLNNVGSFFRTCDAFAVRAIYICGITATPPDKEIHKTALGAELTVEWRHFASATEAISQLHSENYTVAAVEQVHGAVSLEKFTPEQGCSYALIFGNEVFGVEQKAVDMCDIAIEIPQYGTKHSLNVAVSGGVVLWHFFSHYHK